MLLSDLDELSLKRLCCVVVIHSTFLYVFISCLIFYGNHLHENRVLCLTSVPITSPSVTT